MIHPPLVRPEHVLLNVLYDNFTQLQQRNHEFQNLSHQFHPAHTRLFVVKTKNLASPAGFFVICATNTCN
ncbi:hypothetical protein D8M09_02140 [Enterobacter sp. R1(2018)]|nr:hypothetical protein D8M09_02140 [Enterobacter sp. R1(2018)]